MGVMIPMSFAIAVIGVVTLSQVVLITIAWQLLRGIEKKIDDAVVQLRAEIKHSEAQLRMEIKQSEAQLRMEIKQSEAQLRGEMQQLAVELRGEMQQLAVELRGEVRQGVDRTNGMVVGLAERFGQTEQRVSHLEGRETTADTL